MIKKAIILAAGRGTRFHPYTRVVPKEMLPIIDTPAIQLNVEEVINSGVTHICIVSNSSKYDLNHYFEKYPVTKAVKIDYVFQEVPNGTGDALLKAEAFGDGEPVAVLNGDDLIYTGGGEPVIKQLANCYERRNSVVIGVQKVPLSVISKYSSVETVKSEGREIAIKGILEKPQPNSFLSCYAALGRYIVTQEIFDILHTIPVNKVNGELILTDALNVYAKRYGCFAYDFQGKRYDLGSKKGYLEAMTEYALRSDEFGEWYADFLKRTLLGE